MLGVILGRWDLSVPVGLGQNFCCLGGGGIREMLGMMMIHVSGRVVVRRGAGSYPLAMVLSLYVR